MYRVYKMALSELPSGAEYFYYNSKKGYALLFTEKEIERKPVEINELNPEERKWVFECKKKINGKHLKTNEEEYSEYIEDFFKRFEKELEKEVKPK